MQKTIDGVRLGYDDSGSGDVLVLLHGFLLDRSVWDAQAAQLAARRRVVRIDLRGSGQSGTGAGPALMETLAGDVFGLLDSLEVERAIVAGHGLGAYVALAFFRMYAERVAGLGLIAAGTGADSAQQRGERAALAAELAAHGIEPAVETYFPRALAPGASPALQAHVRAVMERQPPGGAAAQLIGMQQRVDCADLLEDIAVPAVIVAGELDPWFSTADAARTAGEIADCTFVGLPGAGHLPMLEAPAATTAALADLARRCAARDACRVNPACF